MTTKEQLEQAQQQAFTEIVKLHTATIKQINPETLIVRQRSQTVRVKINPNVTKSVTNNF